MPTLTDVAANASLDAMGALYAKLHTADPTDAGTAAASVGFPTRVAATLGTAAARARANTADVQWPSPSVLAETITHVSLWDASTAGTCRWRGPLTTPVVVPLSNLFKFATAQLSISLP
jgi:hypothetical protein